MKEYIGEIKAIKYRKKDESVLTVDSGNKFGHLSHVIVDKDTFDHYLKDEQSALGQKISWYRRRKGEDYHRICPVVSIDPWVSFDEGDKGFVGTSIDDIEEMLS